MARFVREFILIPVPFAVVSVFFFLGGVPGEGIFFAVLSLATLWYIRPKKTARPQAAELVSLDGLPGEAPGAPPGSLGSGVEPRPDDSGS